LEREGKGWVENRKGELTLRKGVGRNSKGREYGKGKQGQEGGNNGKVEGRKGLRLTRPLA